MRRYTSNFFSVICRILGPTQRCEGPACAMVVAARQRKDTSGEFQVCFFLAFSTVMRRWKKKKDRGNKKRMKRKKNSGGKASSLNP